MGYAEQHVISKHDPLPVRCPNDDTTHAFSVIRVARGLYRASNGREINANINGAHNILRKVVPDAFDKRRV
jgi:putative transposase